VDELVARTYGRRWGAGAAARAEHFAGMSRPAWEVVADATAVGPGTRVLDVACGSGEFGVLAAARGARVAGIDAAGAMIDLAGVALPGGDLRVGSLERLPWPDAAFDVVTGFNAFQFAPDIVSALREAARVLRPGGLLAVCNRGRPGQNDLHGPTRAVQALDPAPTLVPRRPIGEPGVLEAMLRAAGLTPGASGDVAVPYAPADEVTLLRGLLSAGNIGAVVECAGLDAVRRVLVDGSAPYRRADGSYLFCNTFRWVVGAARPNRP
jgi:SAM-dependent methyltransferase